MSTLAYSMRRLSEAQQATEAPASLRYDFAMSDMDDDTLEQTVSKFGGPAYGDSGFGMSDILNEFLSRDPKFVPVSDLQAYQQNLVATGYADPSLPADGTWNTYWQAAARKSDRDSMNLIRQGQHIGAITTTKFFEYMSKTVPQGIFEAVVGAAKGLAESVQTVATNPIEAAEEAGVLGGAVAGAIGGATVAGPVGAAVGAIGGGIIGGLADFFGDDEGEEGQSLGAKLWDSLSPYDEYKQDGAKNFFALLDTVSLAAGFIKGGQVAFQGTKAALTSASLSPGSMAVTQIGRSATGAAIPAAIGPTGRTVAQAGFREAFRRVAPGQVGPGMVARMTKAALKRPVLGGAALSGSISAVPELLQGDFGDAGKAFIGGAVTGAAGLSIASRTARGAKALAKADDLLSAAPLMRLTESGAGKITRALYTGFAIPATTGRIVADISPGDDPTTRGLKSAENLTESKAWDVMDLTVGMVLYPTRMLPLRPKEVGDALRALDNTHVLMPFIRAEASRLKQRVTPEFVQTVRNKLGAHSVTGEYDAVTEVTNVQRMNLDKAIDDEASRLARLEMPDADNSIVGRFRFSKKESEIRAELVKGMYDEASDPTLPFSPTASKLFETSLDDQFGMQAKVESWHGKGTSIDNLLDERRAQDVLDATNVEGEFRIMPALRHDPENGVEGFLTRQEVTGTRDTFQQRTDEFIAARKQKERNPDNELLKEAHTNAGTALDQHLLAMRNRGLIDDDTYIRLAPQNAKGDYKLDKKVVKQLDEIAELRPVENTELTERLAGAGINRYIAVNTGENMLVTADIPRLLEYDGIGEVVRRPVREWFAAMARKPDDYSDLGPMRYWSIATHLGNASDQLGLGLTSKQMADRLYDFVRNRSDPEWAKLHLNEVVVTNKTGTIIRRTEEGGLGKTRRELLKVDPRDLTTDDIIAAYKLDELPNIKNPDEAARKIKNAAQVGGAFGADMMHPLTTWRELGRSLKLQGLPGFNDFSRTAHVPMVKMSEGDKGWRAFKSAKPGSWAYVPQNMRRFHLAAQFTFSPGFDISRYLEAISFGAGKGMIPPRLVISPGNFMRKAEGLRDPLTGAPVSGPEAYAAMHRFADASIYGSPISTTLDDQFARVNLSGMAGFKPREVEAAQAFWLAQKKAKSGPLTKADMDEIRNTVLEINRYGKGQSAWAKSAHFVFFPFLFQAKQLQLIQDVAFGAPTRSALIHEGFRRWNGIDGDPGLKEEVTQKMEKHFPILRELSRWNNLSYGVGLGRFWFEGLTDSTSANGKVAVNKSTVGQVADAWTRFLLPGGIHGTVGGAVGTATDVAGRWAAEASGWDLLRHAFVPVVIYEDGSTIERSEEVMKLIEGLSPLYRDMQRWMDDKEGALRQQIGAFSPQGSASSQLTSYYDTKRMIDMLKERTADEMGFSSWASLSQSPSGAALAAAAQTMNDALTTEFPQGAELAAKFTNMDSIKGQALLTLANKDERTDAEEVIVTIGSMEDEAKILAGQWGVSQATVLAQMTPIVRALALEYATDKQFANLWESIGFTSTFGPIRLAAA